MSSLAVTNTLANGQSGDATKVEQNFADVETYVNANAVVKDGTVAMTAALTLSGDPSAANDAARKAYVDAGDALADVRCGVKATRTTTQSMPGGIVLITFNNEVADSDGFFAASSTNFTVPAGKAGVYAMSFGPISSGSANIRLYIYVNAVVVCNSTWANGGGDVQYLAWTQPLAVADVVTVGVGSFVGTLNADAAFQMYRQSR